MKKILPLLIILVLATHLSFSQNSLSFDGISDYVNCGNNTSLNITGTAITLEAWIYPTSWRTNVWQGNIISKESTVGTGYMLRAGAGGKLNLNFGSGGPWNELTSSSPVLTLNTWQHVAGTYDGSFLRLYVNGVLTDSIAKTVSMVGTSSVNLYLGQSPSYSGRYFPGRIEEVRVWNVTRTKAEIMSTMNSELCIIPSSLKAYFTFNQGIAGGTNTSVSSLTDLSGNSNTGTLTNFALSGSASNWVIGKPLAPGIVVSSTSVSACGSFTMPDGRIITTAGTYFDTLPSSTSCDSLDEYIISFPPAINVSTVTDSACLIYSTPMGKNITASGTYYDTISTSSGCDTTITYLITISGAVDDSVYKTGSRITSWDTWADHQWVNCDSNYKPITGETNRFFTATAPGNYAVIVKRGMCKDTSECVNIDFVGINEDYDINTISIYPNPVNDILYLDYKKPNSISEIKIIDLTGKEVLKSTTFHSSISVNNLPNGIYFLTISSTDQTTTIKFIKQ